MDLSLCTYIFIVNSTIHASICVANGGAALPLRTPLIHKKNGDNDDDDDDVDRIMREAFPCVKCNIHCKYSLRTQSVHYTLEHLGVIRVCVEAVSACRNIAVLNACCYYPLYHHALPHCLACSMLLRLYLSDVS